MKHHHIYTDEQERETHLAVIDTLMVLEDQARHSENNEVVARLLQRIAILSELEGGFRMVNTLPQGKRRTQQPEAGKRSPPGNR